MFQKILVPVDLADPEFVKPALDTAVELARRRPAESVRLINVIPMTPVMLAEYVPPDFDVQQRGSAEEALAIIAKESGLDADQGLDRGAPGRHLSRGAGGGESVRLRHHRDELAPARDEDLFPRLECRPHGALRQVFGAGGAQAGATRGAAPSPAPRPDGTSPGRLRRKNVPACHRKKARNAAMNAAPLQASTLQRAHDQPGERERGADEHDHAEPVDDAGRSGLKHRLPAGRADAAAQLGHEGPIARIEPLVLDQALPRGRCDLSFGPSAGQISVRNR